MSDNGDGSLAVTIVELDDGTFYPAIDVAGIPHRAPVTPFKTADEVAVWLKEQLDVGGLPPNTRLYDTEGKKI